MSESITASVAAEVRAELARQRVSQQELADAIGISQAAVWRRLRADVPFDVDQLIKAAELLRVPVTQFLPTPVTAAAA